MAPNLAFFVSAPPELLLKIAKQLPDLRTLHNLALAAPSVYRLWGNYGAELLQAVTNNCTFTTPQLRDLIWLVTLLRSAEMPVWSLEAFLERFVRPTMLMNQPPQPQCAVPVPASSPFSVLSTASRIQALTHLCLEYYLEKLREVQPRLRRPVSPSFNYTLPYGPYEFMVPGWQRRTPDVAYDTPNMGAASWVEEQVVLRAFWRLQLFHDFKQAAKHSRLSAWAPEDVRGIASLELGEMFPRMHPNMTQYHELICVREYLEVSNGSDRLAGGNPTGESYLKTELLPIPKEAWFVKSARGPIRSLHYVPDELLRRSMIHPCHTVLHYDESPIKGVSFTVFRRLGFAIWDGHRLAALGLGDQPLERGQKYGPTPGPWKYWYSWRSLLDAEEIAEVERRLAVDEDEETRQARLEYERLYDMHRAAGTLG
ncbi:hypothetical protein F4820DRAFT_408160 [Hypoxylon rubiginosum]|uniref:Uncharacterized protein n=1 Tax=Hypoxylon rubiginosum TaxID=110542 RepID=A0ACB9ZCL9_9PEZI|nr:hypothetical protein F4820DRAFT_408160 [Hypoxylon rubiginosum]